ncbi:NRDE family protein [Planococcus shenhongbingii]|uniref:NRDE family protein n=1 Tax=Planococcus shenhongbingii TaxID=3058398 RepID=A0ABT8N9G1_9BACL|nr:NRDE family protein [Planococcus sp. N017]MDN7244518.1 NRDE family protein [Planococcus sp. N017]
MCLVNFQYKDHPKYKLVLAANRDEFYNRPTEPAHFWKDAPALLAGRDLMQMGTWLGVAKNGRIAALTNFRDPSMPEANKISRGAIVRDFLTSDMEPQLFLESLIPENYTGFNILVGDADHLYYYNNIENCITEIEPGIHGLSNHLLNTPWPKVIKGKNYLERYLSEHEEVAVDDLFSFLADSEQADDSALPETGIGIEFERMLSSMFIKTPEYGTRSATVVLIDNNNHVTFVERVYEKGLFKEQNVFEFDVE